MVMAILEGRKTQTRRVIPIDTDFAAPCCCTVTKGMPRNLLNRYGAMFTAPKESWIDTDKPWHKFIPSPCGGPGTLLWVRETWADVNTGAGPAIMYRADGAVRTWEEFSTTFGPDYGAGPSMDYDAYPGRYAMWWSDLANGAEGHNWRPSIHMPRWASRITLEIVSVRVERLQEISEEDAVAEGIAPLPLQTNEPGCWWSADATARGMHGRTPRAAFKRLWDSIYGPGSWDANPWVWQIEFKVLEVRG